MKILVVCQYYHPEQFRVTDICEELVRIGHEVFVVTGLPNYPLGTIYEGYEKGRRRDEIVNGVRIHRCFTIGRKGGSIKRFLNYYSYVASSSLFVGGMKDDFDVVFVNQLSPVMMATAGLRYKMRHRKSLILYCLDLWPESLIVGGIRKGSLIYGLFHRIAGKIYRQADHILISSRFFSDYLHHEFKIETERISYLPQYAEAIFDPSVCHKEPDGFIDLMFAGNIGKAQSMDTIIRAADATRDIANLRWHIVGDGTDLKRCRMLAEQLQITSVIFHGRKELDEMPFYYAMADAMLVTMQKDPFLSLTLPGKVQTYMAAGKPIIAAADGEIADVIRQAQCGLCVPAEDSTALGECVRDFVTMSDRNRFKTASLEFYSTKFSKTSFINALDYYLSNQIIAHS